MALLLERRTRPFAIATVLVATLLPSVGAGQSVEQSFRGKQIRLLIGSSAGGG
jgi:hypothetical protein